MGDATKTQAFKIEVGCRFRPGERVNKNLVVPLHQFLKVRRQKAADTKTFCVGEADPEEYLDPFLKTLMRDPVKLKLLFLSIFPIVCPCYQLSFFGNFEIWVFWL